MPGRWPSVRHGGRNVHRAYPTARCKTAQVTSRIVLRLGVTVALLAAAACGSEVDSASDPASSSGLRIASFDFAESTLLAELYAQAIESTGVPVVRLGSLGPREVVTPAMELDHADFVPEYLGAAIAFAGVTTIVGEAETARADLNDVLRPRGLMSLEASLAEDKNTFVVTTDLATREGLEKLSDLESIAKEQRFGGPPECEERPLCLAGLSDIYGLHFAEFVPQRTLAFTAEALRRGEIDVGLMFTTASQLVATDLVELVDDRKLQPSENVIPVIRVDALDRFGPDVARAADLVSARLTTTEGLN